MSTQKKKLRAIFDDKVRNLVEDILKFEGKAERLACFWVF